MYSFFICWGDSEIQDGVQDGRQKYSSLYVSYTVMYFDDLRAYTNVLVYWVRGYETFFCTQLRPVLNSAESDSPELSTNTEVRTS